MDAQAHAISTDPARIVRDHGKHGPGREQPQRQPAQADDAEGMHHMDRNEGQQDKDRDG